MAVPTIQSKPETMIAQQTHRAHETFQRNATISPLLPLPAEIRNVIFAYAMYNGSITSLAFSKGSRTTGPSYAKPLLFVCRQIHWEAAILPYELGTFMITGRFYADLRAFLQRRTPEQIAVMREVKFDHTSTGAYEEGYSATEWMELLFGPERL
ncbi:hypothetical protein J4E91_006850 [Alternaria rosae]|nr:hypothetical protein J4E91_006850 [Alternaria rosae]